MKMKDMPLEDLRIGQQFQGFNGAILTIARWPSSPDHSDDQFLNDCVNLTDDGSICLHSSRDGQIEVGYAHSVDCERIL